MSALYDMIFRRKSVRKFEDGAVLTEEMLAEIREETQRLTPLVPGIKVAFRLVERAKTTAKFGEYCLLLYSEKGPHAFLNAGYLMEQMDLFLASREIGACWYGMAKAAELQVDGLDYLIMLSLGRCRAQDFRSDISQFSRKSREEIWRGEFDCDVIEAVRLAPSACNTQPWRIESDGNHLKIARSTKIHSFIPHSKRPFFNSLDLGICLCFLDLALNEKGYSYRRTLIAEDAPAADLVEIATYQIEAAPR